MGNEDLKIISNKQFQVIGYIIKIDKEINKPSYYALDQNSGGYPYWSPRLSSAHIFNTKKEAINIIKTDSCFIHISDISNSSIYPPRLLHSGAGLNNSKLTGKCTIFVSPVLIGQTEFYQTFDVEIKHPKEG